MSRTRVGWCAALVLFALVALLGIGDAGARVRATFVVSPGGGVPGSFSTIQAAVNAAASGDTILVNPGTYTEQVTINKNLTLAGNGSGVVIQAPTTMASDTLALRVIVEVNNAATVTIRGFTIQGPNPEINAGVLVVGGATLNLEDNTVQHINQGTANFGVQTGYAVQAGGSGNQTVGQVGHLTATGNTLGGYQKGGFVIGRNGSTGTIEDNTVMGVGPTPLNTQIGIQVSPGADKSVVEGNYIARNEYTGTGSGDDPFTDTEATGILSFAGNVSIAHNTLKDNDLGMSVSAPSASGPVRVAHNLLEGGALGILVSNITGAKILANTIDGAGGGGILVFAFVTDAFGNLVTQNTEGNTLARNNAFGARAGRFDCWTARAPGATATVTDNTWTNNGGASASTGDPGVQPPICSPRPITTIDLHPAAPDGPGGAYLDRVRVTVSALDGGGPKVTGTRCVLDPPSPPTRFRDLPAGCPYLGPGADVSAPGGHTVYAASVNADGVTDPAIGSASFTITESPAPPRADLAVSKIASTDTVHPGGQVTYTLVVRNLGPGQATGVTVQDRAPPGLSFQQAHPSQGQCTITSVLSCTLGTVDAGDAPLVQVTSTVAPDATGTLVNQATVLGNQDDPNQSNNTATSAVQVTPGAQPVSDLRIQLHDPRVGQRQTFTITVTNLGPDPARQVLVTFTASLPLRIISARHGCTATVPVRCRLDSLPARGRVTFRIVAVPRVPGVLRSTAAVMSASRDPTPHNSVATATTTILPARTPAPGPPPFTG